MGTTTTTAADLETGDYMLVDGTFARVTAAEYHSRNEQVMVCLAGGRGWTYLMPHAEVVIAA